MIKAKYSDPTIQDHGFIKHIHHIMVDLGVYPDDTASRLVEMYKVLLRENSTGVGTAGGKPRNIELYRKVLGPNQDPSTGVWTRLEVWDGDGTGDYDDASSSGSVAVDEKTGQIHVALVFGKLVGGVVRFQDWEQTIERTFAPPIVRLPVASGGVDHSAAVEALQRASEAQARTIEGIEQALGNISQEPGALDAKDRDILDRYRKLHGLD